MTRSIEEVRVIAGQIVQEFLKENPDKTVIRNLAKRIAPEPGLSANNIMNVQKLAAYLQCSRAQVYRLKDDQGMPFLQIGRMVRFNQKDIDAWLKTKEIHHAMQKKG